MFINPNGLGSPCPPQIVQIRGPWLVVHHLGCVWVPPTPTHALHPHAPHLAHMCPSQVGPMYHMHKP